jgi:hypothetical protein
MRADTPFASPAEAAALAREGRVDRIVSAGARDTLERINNPALLGAGAVNIIGLDAVRLQLGERWQRKAARVWEHTEREIERTLGPTALFLRVDDVSYLIAQPGEEGFAAQAACLTILQDVLKFFLGELRPGDVSVRQVTKLDGGEIASAPIDPAALRRRPPRPAEETADTPAERAAEAVSGPLADHAPAPWRPPLAGRGFHIGLTPHKGEPFELELKVEPVWNLRRGLITSFLVDRPTARLRAEPDELEEMDVATAAYVATLLEEHLKQGGPLALHVPISFASLATQRSRERLMRATRHVRDQMKACVLVEIDHLDPGVPPSRLIEVVGLVRSLCGGVLARVRPSKAGMEAVRRCGLRGIVAEADRLGLNDGGGAVRLKAYAAIARDIAPNVLIHGLPRAELIDEATAAGFTHASAIEHSPPA